MRLLPLAAMALAVIFWVSSSFAQGERRQTKRRARGPSTHFIAELGMGAAFASGFPEQSNGIAARTTLGVGGAFKGFPPRFYLIAVGRYSSVGTTVTSGTTTSDVQRQLIDFSAGLRVLVPIDRFRVLTELTLGSSYVGSTATVNKRENYETAHQRFAVYAALGGQYRLHKNWSVGLSAEWSFPTSRPLRDFVADVSRLDPAYDMQGWTSLTGSVLVHF